VENCQSFLALHARLVMASCHTLWVFIQLPGGGCSRYVLCCVAACCLLSCRVGGAAMGGCAKPTATWYHLLMGKSCSWVTSMPTPSGHIGWQGYNQRRCIWWCLVVPRWAMMPLWLWRTCSPLHPSPYKVT